jgi:hypothetical protein
LYYDAGWHAPAILLLLQSTVLTKLGFHRISGFRIAQPFEAAVAAAPSPPLLPNLRVLTADVRRADVTAITAALRHAPLLTSVALLVPGEDARGVLPAMGVLAAALQLLQLEFDADTVLPAAEIQTLRALNDLRELVLQPPLNRTFCFLVVAPDFTDAHLAHLLAGLPKLRRFVFGGKAGWWKDVHGRYLERLGHAAPLLEELCLAGSYGVQALNPLAPAPAFPFLQTLVLCQLSLVHPGLNDRWTRKEIEYLQ